jgi:dynein light chain roadblock-type
VQLGVEGYVICNKQGQVLRRFPTMTQDDAEKYARTMISLVTQARGVVRDLNPKVNHTNPSIELLAYF